jgi:RimJ/RimL family protein N-acetyltransferase
VSHDWSERLPRLEAGAIALRAPEARDVEGLLALFGDERVARWTTVPRLASRAAARRLFEDVLERFAQRTLFQWTVVGPEDRLLGTASLVHWEPAHGRAEIGYAILHAEQGRGLARAASARLVGFAFETLGLKRLEADVDPRNAASLHLLEKQGFRREGHLRRRYRIAGEWHDAVLLGLLREEWSAGAGR